MIAQDYWFELVLGFRNNLEKMEQIGVGTVPTVYVFALQTFIIDCVPNLSILFLFHPT